MESGEKYFARNLGIASASKKKEAEKIALYGSSILTKILHIGYSFNILRRSKKFVELDDCYTRLYLIPAAIKYEESNGRRKYKASVRIMVNPDNSKMSLNQHLLKELESMRGNIVALKEFKVIAEEQAEAIEKEREILRAKERVIFRAEHDSQIMKGMIVRIGYESEARELVESLANHI